MHITTKATNIQLDDSVSNYLQPRLEAIERLIDPSDTTAMCNVEVGRITEHHQEGKVFRAEINITTVGGAFRATAVKDSLTEAIDEVKDEIMQELRRHKDKQGSLLRRGGRRIKDLLRFGR